MSDADKTIKLEIIFWDEWKANIALEVQVESEFGKMGVGIQYLG